MENDNRVGTGERVVAHLRRIFALLKAKRERKDIAELVALKTNLE